MTSSAIAVSTITIAINLEDDPSRFFLNWYRLVRQAASNLMNSRVGFTVYGLIFLVISAQQWAAYEGNLDEHGDVILPPIPVMPLPLANGATHVQVSNHKQAVDQYHEYQTNVVMLKKAILLSMGPTLLRDFTNPDAGDTVTLTIPQIIARLVVLFGTFSALDIRNLHLSLSEPLSGDDVPAFLAFSSKFRETLAQLAQAGHPVNRFSQLDTFAQSAASQHQVTRAIDQYILQNPLLENRNIADIVHFVRLQLSNATTISTGYAGAASQSVSLADVHSIVNAALAQQSKPSLPKRQVQAGTMYCYVHGYKAHWGSNCTKMLQDQTNKYTAAMLAAKNHTAVAGGHV